jgi:hypothetical protein
VILLGRRHHADVVVAGRARAVHGDAAADAA